MPSCSLSLCLHEKSGFFLMHYGHVTLVVCINYKTLIVGPNRHAIVYDYNYQVSVHLYEQVCPGSPMPKSVSHRLTLDL